MDGKAETQAAAAAAAAPASEPALPLAVVVTAHDQARFLGDALASIARQQQPPAEVVVIDDGSHDDPAAIARSFAQVRLIRQPQQGLAAARNAGLAAISAPQVLFLDADDVLHPGALAAGSAALAAAPGAALAYGAYRMVDAALIPHGGRCLRPLSGDPLGDLLHDNRIGMHGAVVYDSALLRAEGGFDPALAMCEDYDCYLRLAARHKLVCHPALMADYRLHEANMSRDLAAMLRWVRQVHTRHRPPTSDPLRLRRWRAGRRFLAATYAAEAFGERRAAEPAARRRQQLAMLRLSPMHALGALGWQALRPHLPPRALMLARRLAGREAAPAPGQVDFGDLGRTTPISRQFGYDRGTPVDRHYIERFLARAQRDIAGHVLEVGDATYSQRFGGARVARQDVLNRDPGGATTLAGDLAAPGTLPAATFDCALVTQTLHLLPDLHAAFAALHASLRPGGVLLATVPGVSSVDTGAWAGAWRWSLTARSAEELAAAFGPENVTVAQHGNVYAATAFLHGLAVEEVDRAALDMADPAYPVIVTIRAVAR